MNTLFPIFSLTGLKSYSLGINEYADLQHYEFVKVMNGLLARSKSSSSPAADQRVLDRVDYLPPLVKMQIPDTVDWRGQGWVHIGVNIFLLQLAKKSPKATQFY